MSQQALARWLKCITWIIAVAMILFFFLLVPQIGFNLSQMHPQTAHFYPFLVAAIWLSAIPCGGALICFWRICGNIGRDRSFCIENVRALRNISRFALIDVVWCIVVTAVFALLNVFHFSFVIAGAFLVLAGAAIALAAAALAHLTDKAVRMKEENDLTI